MATTPPAADAAPQPAKSKKLLIIGAVVALLLVIAGVAAVLLMSSRAGAEEDGQEDGVQSSAPAAAPTFLPLENMVVNLADPGGERFIQVGIILELRDAKAAATVNGLMVEPGSNKSVTARLRWASCLLPLTAFGLNDGTLAMARTSPVRISNTTAVPLMAPLSSTALFSSR